MNLEIDDDAIEEVENQKELESNNQDENHSKEELEINSQLVGGSPQDLEKIIRIYDTICEVKKQKDPNKEKQLRQELDTKMPKIASILKEALQDDVPVQLRNAAILKVKGELLSMASEKMIEEVTDKVSAEIWRSIKTNYDSAIKEFLNNINYEKIASIPQNSKANDEEIQGLTQIIQTLEEELKASNEKRELVQRTLESEKQELLIKIATLEEERKKQIKKCEIIPKSIIEPPKDVKRYISAPTYSNIKSMQLGQLKDIIFDIYQQKIKYDAKSAANNQSKETMEQYMYIYLNQIYGLKNLIIEGAGGIIQGIKKYSLLDSDVALFGKILRNECDEDFRFVFAEVKAAMINILKEKLKSKYKSKTESELTKIVKEIQQGEIEEKYWSSIIIKMYNEDHYRTLYKRIKDKIGSDMKSIKVSARKTSREELNSIRSKQGSKLLYSDFQKIVLDFQLSTHENYLKKFTKLFKEIDTERDGVLNETGFRIIIDRMQIPAEEKDIQRFLQRIDPYNNEKITYSECLALFSSVICI